MSEDRTSPSEGAEMGNRSAEDVNRTQRAQRQEREQSQRPAGTPGTSNVTVQQLRSQRS